MEEKRCLNCGEPVGAGRRDKKYCSEPCRTEYNNKQKEPTLIIPGFVIEINKIILNNWKILHDCLAGKPFCKMKVSDLDRRNFNFKFFTSERVNEQDGDVYYFCYDVGFKLVKEETWAIVVKNENMARLSGPAIQLPKADGLS